MGYTLSNILQDLYGELGQARVYPASGGSTTSAIVAHLANQDALEEGYLFVVETTDGLAPQGEYQRITAYTQGSSDSTFTTDAFTVAIGSGDIVLYVPNLYPLHTMVEMVNAGLRMLGGIEQIYDSLTTADNQTEYTIPVAQKRDVLRVQVQTELSDSNDNVWEDVPNWDIVPAAPGTGSTLIIPQYNSGYTIRVFYIGVHPRLNTYADVILEGFDPELAMKSAKVKWLEWWNGLQQGQDPNVGQMLNAARFDYVTMRDQRLPKLRRKSGMLSVE